MLLRSRNPKTPGEVIHEMKNDMARLRGDIADLRAALTRSGRKSVMDLSHSATDHATKAMHSTGKFVRERPVLTIAGSTLSILGIFSILALAAAAAGLAYFFNKR